MLDWINPGATLFTVIFLVDNSRASDFTKPDIAAFDAVYNLPALDFQYVLLQTK
ncbi:MAG: hypothetical protein CM15mP72_5250 [Pelagibacteraceae bacterium]|nr:MAG: hypothetical protein CM15mP72_5250 [Pelagibacteraceae bacterium]